MLLSRDDSRCFHLSEDGHKKLKYPNNNDYLNEPIYLEIAPFYISIESISGVLYFCKKEALTRLWPLKEHEELNNRLKEKYSQPLNNKKTVVPEDEPLPEPVKLKFFNERIYHTSEEQQSLRNILKNGISSIDTTNGRDWFAFYAAYRYVQDLRKKKLAYVDFFSDIENLLPEALPKLNRDEKGDKRYKHYTTQISKELDNWYVDGGKLPPLNNLAYDSYHFRCSKDMFKSLEGIIKYLFKELKHIEEELKMKKGIKTI